MLTKTGTRVRSSMFLRTSFKGPWCGVPKYEQWTFPCKIDPWWPMEFTQRSAETQAIQRADMRGQGTVNLYIPSNFTSGGTPSRSSARTMVKSCQRIAGPLRQRFWQSCTASNAMAVISSWYMCNSTHAAHQAVIKAMETTTWWHNSSSRALSSLDRINGEDTIKMFCKMMHQLEITKMHPSTS